MPSLLMPLTAALMHIPTQIPPSLPSTVQKLKNQNMVVTESAVLAQYQSRDATLTAVSLG